MGDLFGSDKKLEPVFNRPFHTTKHLDFPALNNSLAYETTSLGALTFLLTGILW